MLDRYFQSGAGGEIGSGRASARMLGRFAANSMVATSGLRGSDPDAAHAQDVCQFSSDRLSAAQKVAFIHQLMGREMAEVRSFLDRYREIFRIAELRRPASARGFPGARRDRTR